MEEETSTRPIVDFQNDRSVVQSPKNLNRRERIQILSKGCEVDFCWETTGVLENSELSTSKTDCVEVPDNCSSVISVVYPGNSSGECRFQVMSLASVAELEWVRYFYRGFMCSDFHRRGGHVSRNNRTTFTELTEQFQVCPIIDTMKTTVHNKGVIEACRPDSEECKELLRSYDRTMDL